MKEKEAKESKEETEEGTAANSGTSSEVDNQAGTTANDVAAQPVY